MIQVQEIRIAPKNSLILIMDLTIGKVPESMNGSIVAWTHSCVAVGTISEFEGETSICLTDDAAARVPSQAAVFDGVLDTPSKRISVCSVLNEALMALDVPQPKTRVQIWINDGSEPDEIQIVAVNDRP